MSDRSGGVLLLVATVLALVAANVGETYGRVRDFTVGPAALHLDLTIGAWTSDGLLALFFFLIGIELKREFMVGDLHDWRHAALPIAAAAGGMVVPALLYVVINRGGAVHWWAVPTATDIAFALAVLAVVGRNLPAGVRAFLLTLAVVDDLLAIMIIAFVYAEDIDVRFLVAATAPLMLFALLLRRGFRVGWVLVPLALLTWGLVHESGVHATVAGVLLGFAVPLAGSDRLERILGPLSAGIAVPLFAFFAAGVSFAGLDEALRSPITVGVAVGLVAGKSIGVAATTWLTAALTHAELPPGLSWWNVLGVAVLSGMGFTVALLIGELAFEGGSPEATLGVLVGSATSALLAALILTVQNRHHLP